jgi:hypothetical protein
MQTKHRADRLQPWAVENNCPWLFWSNTNSSCKPAEAIEYFAAWWVIGDFSRIRRVVDSDAYESPYSAISKGNSCVPQLFTL